MEKSRAIIVDTAIFKIDQDKNVILSLTDQVNSYLNINFTSLTTDQPLYRPGEEVFLKQVSPVTPGAEILISLQKKDSVLAEIGKFTLNEAGILVQKIMDGTTNKIEPGEYTVFTKDVKTNREASTTFSVAEGSLGALSFAYEFQKVTKPEELVTAKGGWFLGNAGGIGLRWGNGLNIKNQIRVLNKPYNGTAVITPRCFLPGCNGVEAGPAVTLQIKDGLLEAVLEIGGHSGPFGVDVNTDQGSIRNVFEKSSHVERQNIVISSGLSKKFYAVLAPYEGTTPIYGRDIYFFEQKEEAALNALELSSPVSNTQKEIELLVKKDLKNSRMFVYSLQNGQFIPEEIKLPSLLTKEQKIKAGCHEPYSFIAVGGFLADTNKYYEGWCVAFTESEINVTISHPAYGTPLKNYNIGIKTSDKNLGKALSLYGILEVFDNRAVCMSVKEPLTSSVGDSMRSLSGSLTSWRDTTGIMEEECMDEEDRVTNIKEVAFSLSRDLPSMKKSAKRSAKYMDDSFAGTPPPMAAPKSEAVPPSEIPDLDTEPVREGEKRVVFCGVVKTDSNGTGNADVTLPPQTGRLSLRFTAVRGYDILESLENMDVTKNTTVELSLQPMIIKDAIIYANAAVINNEPEKVTLLLYGACLKENLSFEIKTGSQQIEFELTGRNWGSLFLEIKASNGEVLDKREIKLSDTAAYPMTFSDLVVSDGAPVKIGKERKAALYSNPGFLLKGIIPSIVTTIYSWFGHSEALSSAAAIRAVLLLAIEEKLLSDDGLLANLKSELVKTIKDIHEAFFNPDSGLFYPYPGIPENISFSLWVFKNLITVEYALKNNKNLKNEFAELLKLSSVMTTASYKALKAKNVSFEEDASFDPKTGKDVIPVEINGKVVYKAVTDGACVKWFTDKILPGLDIAGCAGSSELCANLITQYDKHRFLKAFERTGSIYYLLLNVKALFLNESKEFFPLFSRISTGLINTFDPGLIQGPALSGGVYSSPRTLMLFLDLLVTMAQNKHLSAKANMEVKCIQGSVYNVDVADTPHLFETNNKDYVVTAPCYSVMRIDLKKEIHLYDYLQKDVFFTVKSEKTRLKTGEETTLSITLDNDRDPAAYYAVVAVPSVLFLKQTGDLLRDYKGRLLYGTESGSGFKISMFTAPFRGSKTMDLIMEAGQRGISPGYVLVRSLTNPDIVAAIKINDFTVTG